MKNAFQILVVGKSINNIINIQRAITLDNLNIELHAEGNPIEAFRYLQNAQRKFPDVIIVDLEMPIIDGFEFAERFLLDLHINHPTTRIYLCGKSYPLLEANEIDENPIILDFMINPITPNHFTEKVLPTLNVLKKKTLLRTQASN